MLGQNQMAVDDPLSLDQAEVVRQPKQWKAKLN